MNKTINDAICHYQNTLETARSSNTARTYKNALALFMDQLTQRKINPESTPIDELPEETVSWFTEALKPYAAATERLYLTALIGFFEYVTAEGWATPNLLRIRQIVRLRGRKPGLRLPQFPKENIEKVIEYATTLNLAPTEDDLEALRNLRDRAFILTLADTGLRVHEACNLRRGDFDWAEAKAVIIGKGNQESIVRFSSRAIGAIKAYLQARASLDGASKRPLPTLPIFAQHAKKSGTKIKPITTRTGHTIITERVVQVLGEEQAGSITPHSFRHYFVTSALIGSGGNLKMAQELARHKNIAVTQRYAHLSDDELDKGYHEIFEKND